jgi:cellulose synthase operon protein C
MRLFDVIGHWLGRFEVVLAGADEMLRAGEQALATGDAMRARSMARRVLDRLPGSPLGLALLADACEVAGLDAELAEALEELAIRLPSNADVWVRLGRIRQKTDPAIEPTRDAYLRALALAEPGSEARRDALVALSNLDLARHDGTRALAWLDRLEGDTTAEVALSRAEAHLSLGNTVAAHNAISKMADDPTDARAAMTRGRILAASGNEAAFSPILRAYMLDAPGASELLSSTLAWVPADAATCEKVRIVVDAHGEAHLARWRAAFARSRGGSDEARAALEEALAGGDASAARPLFDAAVEDRNEAALGVALAALDPKLDDALVRDARTLLRARKTLATAAESGWSIESFGDALDALASVASDRLESWGKTTRLAIVQGAVPRGDASASWGVVLARLDAHARAVHDLDAAAKVAEVAVERRRPLRLAIVGEFNAGKSTFINALMGADVAPTGVLPTTATLHHLRYAPDPIARIVFDRSHEPPERLLPVENLRKALKELQNEPIVRVEIGVPLPALTRVEVIDTPGFNAPDASHTRAARRAFDESDVALWLLDATQPLKQTEREIMEEVRAAKIPLQILINKADRLNEKDLATVMQSTLESLAALNISSWSPPIAFSARLALAAKLGDEAAQANSHWDEIEAMFESQIVARAEALKEKALRRRASSAIALIRARAQTLAEDESRASLERAERAHRFAVVAARIDRNSADAAKSLAASLLPAIAAWQNDLTMVVTGRDAQTAAASAAFDRYRADRVLAHLSQPLALALAGLSDGTGLTPSDLASTARAIARPFGFFRAIGDPKETMAEPMARAAVATLLDLLVARSVVEPAPRTAGGRARELASFDEALA